MVIRHSAADDDVDGDDPFSLPARSRSPSPSRAAVPNATVDRDSLRALFECTGGRSWRTSLGWPSWEGVPRASRNPFGEVAGSNVDDTKRGLATAAAATGAGSGCSIPQRTGGGGSPCNPFARNGNPFAPLTPTRSTFISNKTASPPAGRAANTRRATETLASPPACLTSSTDTPTAMRRGTEMLPSPPSLPSRGTSPLAVGANARKVRTSRYRSPSPPADAQTRSALLDPPRQRSSRSLEAEAAWFGVSLGKAARVTELKLVDNGLVGTLPSALGGLEMLRYLHLGRNALSGGLSAINVSVSRQASRANLFLFI